MAPAAVGRGAARRVVLAVAALAAVTTSPALPGTNDAGAVATSGPGAPAPSVPPCAFDATVDAIHGTQSSASAIGWAGNGQGVVTCLGGSFFVGDGIDRAFGFGLARTGPVTWTDAQGYLPAQVTTFAHSGTTVHLTEFADRVSLGSGPFVAVYCRVRVVNPTGRTVAADPAPTPGLVPLATAPTAVPSDGTTTHDYVIAVDRFGTLDPWPAAAQLVAAGGFDQHFAHMAAYWHGQLAQIAEPHLPDQRLVDAYRSGFIETEIARSGDHVNTGVNGYAQEYSHDVIGILADRFTEGASADAHALLLEARTVVGAQGQYPDGVWTYPWPWAIYLLKTGDTAFVRANFSTEGPTGTAEPSIEDTAHAIAAARTGPDGIIGPTDDIDTDGLWTVDDFEALTGLAAYRYLAAQLGDTTEAQWASSEYASLLASVDEVLGATIARYHLHYLPCSMVQPNTKNRCDHPADANWAAPFLFGRWAWDAKLLGATVSGPGVSLIDATYAYGFARLAGRLPPNTFGGYPGDEYSTAYNAGYGSWGLAGSTHRDQGILSYQFMVDRTQNGPLSWWESSAAPPRHSSWTGSHPASGQGASPHAWGSANDDKVLLDSIAAQQADGSLVVGRGVPNAWVQPGRSVGVTGFPTVGGRRVSITVTGISGGVRLSLAGTPPPGGILFELPAFVGHASRASAGSVDRRDGIVRVPPGVRSVTVSLG